MGGGRREGWEMDNSRRVMDEKGEKELTFA